MQLGSEDFIAKHMRRTGLTFVAYGIAGILFVGVIIGTTWNYWLNAAVVTRFDVTRHAAVRSADDLLFNRVVVDGKRWAETGWILTKKGRFRKSTLATFVQVAVGDRSLIVKTDDVNPDGELEGVLRDPKNEEERAVVSAIAAENVEGFGTALPYILDQTNSRFSAAVNLLALLALLGYSIYQLRKAGRWRKDPTAHPIWKRLQELGDPEVLAKQISDEAPTAEQIVKRPDVRLTASGALLIVGRERLHIALLDRLVAAGAIHKTADTPHQLYLRDASGRGERIELRRAVADAILLVLAERAPWIGQADLAA